MAELPPRDAPHDYRRHLPHFEGRGACLYITFKTRDHYTLPYECRSLVMKHILHDHGRKMSVISAVVMPDHVHLIYQPWNDANGVRYTKTEIIGSIKTASAHSINKLLGRTVAG